MEEFIGRSMIIGEVFATHTDGAIAESKMLGVQSAVAKSGATAAWRRSRR